MRLLKKLKNYIRVQQHASFIFFEANRKELINVYLDDLYLLTKKAFDIFPEPKIITAKNKKDDRKRWAEHYVVVKTLLKCYDNLDKNPTDIFEEEVFQYSLARVETKSLEKKKLYSIYIHALNKIICMCI